MAVKNSLLLKDEIVVSAAIDVGHSAIKWGFMFDIPKYNVFTLKDGKESPFFCDSFPTATAVNVHFIDEEHLDKAEVDRVFVKNIENGEKQEFFVGETALYQGSGTFFGNEKNWVTTYNHDALILSALQRIYQKVEEYAVKYNINVKKYHVEFGLPTKYYAEQKPILTERLERLFKNDFEYRVGDRFLIEIKTQSEAPLWTLGIDNVGDVITANDIPLSNYRWVIGGIGHHTSECVVTIDGHIINNRFVSVDGVSQTYQRIKQGLVNKGFYVDNTDKAIEQALVTRRAKKGQVEYDVSDIINEAVEDFAESFANTIRTLVTNPDEVDGFIITGGGASLVMDKLRKIYPEDKVISITDLEQSGLGNDRYAVALGLMKRGLLRIKAIKGDELSDKNLNRYLIV